MPADGGVGASLGCQSGSQLSSPTSQPPHSPPGSQSPHQYTGHEESISKLPSRMFSVTTSPVAAGVLTELRPGQNALGRSEGKAKSKRVLLT